MGEKIESEREELLNLEIRSILLQLKDKMNEKAVFNKIKDFFINLNSKEKKSCLNVFEKYLKIKPNYEKVWYYLGLLRNNIEDFERVLTINPENFKAWFQIGFQYYEKMDKKIGIGNNLLYTARNCFLQALGASNLKIMRNINEEDLVFPNIESVLIKLKLEKVQKNALAFIGNSYVRLGEIRNMLKAKKYLFILTKVEPDSINAWKNLCFLYEALIIREKERREPNDQKIQYYQKEFNFGRKRIKKIKSLNNIFIHDIEKSLVSERFSNGLTNFSIENHILENPNHLDSFLMYFCESISTNKEIPDEVNFGELSIPNWNKIIKHLTTKELKSILKFLNIQGISRFKKEQLIIKIQKTIDNHSKIHMDLLKDAWFLHLGISSTPSIREQINFLKREDLFNFLMDLKLGILNIASINKDTVRRFVYNAICNDAERKKLFRMIIQRKVRIDEVKKNE